VDALVGEALRTIFDGMATTQIERALVLAAAAFIERDPAYSVAAARLQLDALFREVTRRSPGDGDRDAHYREAFAAGLRRGIGSGLYDARLLASTSGAGRGAAAGARCLLQYLGVQTLADRYLAKDDGRTWSCRRRSGCASRWASPSTRRADGPGDRLLRPDVDAALRAVDADAVPRRHAAAAALVLLPDDGAGRSRAHLQGARRQRPALEVVGRPRQRLDQHPRHRRAHRQHARRSQGVVPFLKVANDVTMAINRSGKRRGATCAYLEAWHYDIEDFLELRRNTGDERRRTHDMNTAVWIPDLFMARVEADGPWTLFSPDEVPDLHEIYGRAFADRYRAGRGPRRARRAAPAPHRPGRRRCGARC
jgi:ribonucleoside-diphosphate reductase alpha chain